MPTDPYITPRRRVGHRLESVRQPGAPDAARVWQYQADLSPQQAIDAAVRSADRTLLLISGGERAGDAAMLEKARQSMEAGATGLIFGRNVSSASTTSSLRFVGQLREILARYPS